LAGAQSQVGALTHSFGISLRLTILTRVCHIATDLPVPPPSFIKDPPTAEAVQPGLLTDSVPVPTVCLTGSRTRANLVETILSQEKTLISMRWWFTTRQCVTEAKMVMLEEETSLEIWKASDSDSGSEHVTVQYDKDSGYINLRPDKVYRFVLKKVDGRK
jgi:hypothetical protein